MAGKQRTGSVDSTRQALAQDGVVGPTDVVNAIGPNRTLIFAAGPILKKIGPLE